MRNKRNAGFALIAVLIVGLGLAILATLISTRSVSDNHQSQSFVDVTRSVEAAESGLDLAAAQLWSDYLATDPAGNGTSGTLGDFTSYVDDIVADGDAGEELLDAPAAVGGQSSVSSITLARQDDAMGVTFTVASLGTSRQQNRAITQSMRVGGDLFGGFDYALLANNISCMLCHAKFENIDLNLNTDEDLYGTFSRVKVAALESTMIRNLSGAGWFADTSIDGTFYTRGTITDQDGNLLDTLEGTTFTGHAFDDDGNIIQDNDGDLTDTDLIPAGLDGNGHFLENENLYMDYPSDPSLMTDGDLPSAFPSIVPDTNLNRTIDAAEWTSLVSGFQSDGTIGGITGGIRYALPAATAYSATTLPAASNAAGATLSTGSYTGNAFLVGTAASPIVINGKVMIDGDLVIKGPIQGTGQIFTKGNIYFVGDVTYADSAGEFGQYVSGGTTTQNLVAFAAGGNTVIGDYLSPAFQDMTASNYTTQVISAPVMNTGGWMNFTQNQMAMANRGEYQKFVADPNYIPRFYRLNSTDTLFRSNVEGEALYFDGDIKKITSAQLGTRPVVYSSYGPTNGWLSNTSLKNFWKTDNLSRPAAGTPFKIDGLLYTSNSILMIAKGANRHARYKGEIQVRGGVVTADVGILGTASGGVSGFSLFWDERVSDFLSIQDVGSLSLTRGLRVFSVPQEG